MTYTGITLPGTNRRVFVGRQNRYDHDSMFKSAQKAMLHLHEVTADPEGDKETPLTWYLWSTNFADENSPPDTPDKMPGNLFVGTPGGATVTYPAMTVHREVFAGFTTPVKPKDFKAFVDMAFPHKTGNATWEQIKDDIAASCAQSGKGCTSFPGCGSPATPFCEGPITYTPPSI